MAGSLGCRQLLFGICHMDFSTPQNSRSARNAASNPSMTTASVRFKLPSPLFVYVQPMANRPWHNLSLAQRVMNLLRYASRRIRCRPYQASNVEIVLTNTFRACMLSASRRQKAVTPHNGSWALTPICHCSCKWRQRPEPIRLCQSDCRMPGFRQCGNFSGRQPKI